MSAYTASLAVQLPYLRRFARALTGSQEVGDSYALAALESAVSNAEHAKEDDDPAIWLFRALLKVWTGVVLRHPEGASDPSQRAEAADLNLRAITPLPRAAFLLHSMEGFSFERVASILDCSIGDVRSLIEQAAREIGEQITTDVLIIEDELIISMDLEAVVEELGHRVVQVARTRTEALDAVAKQPPGLVLADIHLADDSSGLDAVNEIVAKYQIPVVFITAYPEQVLTGLRPEPTFLITKPFRTETVKAVISQALFFDVRVRQTGRAEADAPAQ
jgi:DNA-directed RNA polymerase specialized sigma24 family protein